MNSKADTQGSDETPTTLVVTRRQSLGITASSIIGAVAVFIVTIITSKILSPQDNAQFLVFWALMFGVFGAVLGIQQEVTRAVGQAALNSSQQLGTRVLPVAALLGLTLATILLASSPLWGHYILGEAYILSVLVIAAGLTLYSCHVSVVGSAAGSGNWSIFAWLGGWESVLRLALTAIVAITAGTLWGFQFAAIAPVTLWLGLIIISPRGRKLAAARADVSATHLAKNMGWSVLTYAAYAMMVTGFPVLLKAASTTGDHRPTPLLLSGLILGISITRAPIMIPLQMFQGVAVSIFLRQQHRPIAALAKPLGALLGLGLIGALAAYLLGPFLFGLLYSDYKGVLSAAVLAALTFASAFMATVVLTGTAILATGRYKTYFLGWFLTLAVACAALILPLPLDTRAVIALIAGPLTGALTHITGMALLKPPPAIASPEHKELP